MSSERQGATLGLIGHSRDFQFATSLGKNGKQKGSFVMGSSSLWEGWFSSCCAVCGRNWGR